MATSSAVEPPFRTVTVVGLGLIGGSIALAVREQWPSVTVFGADKASVLAHAQDAGAIYRGAEDFAALPPADLVVLAAPVLQNVALLRELGPGLPASTVVTDVGSTKRDIVRASHSGAISAAFIAGHPIGGAERGGFGFARPDLFRGRPWIFTPEPDSRSDAVERLVGFARQLGARPAIVDAERHDRLMAFLSHLPQLTASALMAVIGGAVDSEGLKLAGRGLVDTTRLAASPVDTWREICAANADGIGAALDELIAALARLRSGLEGGEAVEQTFDHAARWRAELMRGRDSG
jgi:prephenate dehydrogenase